MRPTRVRTLIEKQRSKQGAHDMERWNMCMLHLHVMCIAVCCMLVACACACACMCITCACACCMYVHACCACMHVARACMCMCLGHRHSCWGRDLTPRHRVAAEERYSVPNGVWGGRVAATGSCVRSARTRSAHARSVGRLSRSSQPFTGQRVLCVAMPLLSMYINNKAGGLIYQRVRVLPQLAQPASTV